MLHSPTVMELVSYHRQREVRDIVLFLLWYYSAQPCQIRFLYFFLLSNTDWTEDREETLNSILRLHHSHFDYQASVPSLSVLLLLLIQTQKIEIKHFVVLFVLKYIKTK